MNRNNQQAIKTFIAIVILAGVLGILSILAGSISEITGKLFMICYSLIVFGLLAAPCMVVAEKPQYKGLGAAGMITASLGFLFTLICILAGIGQEDMLRFILILFVASFALAQMSFLFHINIQNKYAGYARITATVAIAIFSFVIITQSFQSLPSFYMMGANQEVLKIVGGSFIASLAATLLVPLCNRLHIEEPVAHLSFTEEEQKPPPVEEITQE